MAWLMRAARQAIGIRNDENNFYVDGGISELDTLSGYRRFLTFKLGSKEGVDIKVTFAWEGEEYFSGAITTIQMAVTLGVILARLFELPDEHEQLQPLVVSGCVVASFVYTWILVFRGKYLHSPLLFKPLVDLPIFFMVFFGDPVAMANPFVFCALFAAATIQLCKCIQEYYQSSLVLEDYRELVTGKEFGYALNTIERDSVQLQCVNIAYVSIVGMLYFPVTVFLLGNDLARRLRWRLPGCIKRRCSCTTGVFARLRNHWNAVSTIIQEIEARLSLSFDMGNCVGVLSPVPSDEEARLMENTVRCGILRSAANAQYLPYDTVRLASVEHDLGVFDGDDDPNMVLEQFMRNVAHFKIKVHMLIGGEVRKEWALGSVPPDSLSQNYYGRLGGGRLFFIKLLALLRLGIADEVMYLVINLLSMVWALQLLLVSNIA